MVLVCGAGSGSTVGPDIPEYKRHLSMPVEKVTAEDPHEGTVLKKVASLTLSKLELETRICKPKFVPEKLDFQLYEKFEGKNFIQQSILPIRNIVNIQELY